MVKLLCLAIPGSSCLVKAPGGITGLKQDTQGLLAHVDHSVEDTTAKWPLVLRGVRIPVLLAINALHLRLRHGGDIYVWVECLSDTPLGVAASVVWVINFTELLTQDKIHAAAEVASIALAEDDCLVGRHVNHPAANTIAHLPPEQIAIALGAADNRHMLKGLEHFNELAIRLSA